MFYHSPAPNKAPDFPNCLLVVYQRYDSAKKLCEGKGLIMLDNTQMISLWTILTMWMQHNCRTGKGERGHWQLREHRTRLACCKLQFQNLYKHPVVDEMEHY